MIFLKLGGSLITDKSRPESARRDVISRLAEEIATVKAVQPDMQILLGHGSGSFGHPAAHQFGTRKGASTEEDWIGFSQVWYVANTLNRIVVDALRAADLPAISLPPSASAISAMGEIVDMAVEPIDSALHAGLIPVVQGDVAFDREQGSSILSTELLFRFLAPRLEPERVLLAGIEPGVSKEYPTAEEILPQITEQNLPHLRLGPSERTDVTGGMAEKVHLALDISRAVPGLIVRIFSGEEPGALESALTGKEMGTGILYQG